MTSTIKSRTVTFTYGTCKNAVLKVPAEAFSLIDAAALIRESFIEHMFNNGGLMSDEVFISSIGRSNFFAGALGGYEDRLSAEKFAVLKELCENNIGMAVAVASSRNPNLSEKAAYQEAAKNKALTEKDRKLINIIVANIEE